MSDINKAFVGLRGWAFAHVLFEHYTSRYISAPIGIFGVDIFFVLSAFLLTTNLLRSLKHKGKMNIANYFIKRAFRIYPLLVIVIIICIYINFLNLDIGLKILLLQSKYRFFWTIYVEMRFYFVLPILMFFYIRFKHYLALLLVLGYLFAFAQTYYYNFELKLNVRIDLDESMQANMAFFNFLPVFYFGFAAAMILHFYIEDSSLKQTLSHAIWRVASCILFFSHFIFALVLLYFRVVYNYENSTGVPVENFGHLFSFGYALLLVLISVHGNMYPDTCYSSCVLTFLGKISYAGYLLNIPIRGIVRDLNKTLLTLDELSLIILTLLVLFLVCYVFTVTVEAYFINLSKKLCLTANLRSHNIEEISANQPRSLPKSENNNASSYENIQMLNELQSMDDSFSTAEV